MKLLTSLKSRGPSALITVLVSSLPLARTAAQSASNSHHGGNHVHSSASNERSGFTFPPGKSAVQVPFELLANAMVLSLQVNGKGPYLFEIDTGASDSTFASEVVGEMGFKPQDEMDMGGMGAGSSYKMGKIHEKVEFALPGGLKFHTPGTTTGPMASLWPLMGRRIYGDIGYDVLKNLVVQFDYEKHVVTFLSPRTYKYSGNGKTLEATLLMENIPQIAGTFTVPGMAPISAKFTIDTGAGGTVLTTPLVATNHLLEHVRPTLPVYSQAAVGSATHAVLGRIESVSPGPYQVQQPLVGLSQDKEGAFAMDEVGVLLGGNILKRFTVTIDYPHRTVTLEPNSHFADPFPADASGLQLKAEGSDFRSFVVAGVVPNSPAANAGLRTGDVITSFDVEPAKKYALWELQELLTNSGHVVRLTVKRGDQSITHDLQLRSLL